MKQIKAAGLETYVHLLGMRQDIPQLLAISQLFILPSVSEGLPNALLEAMAAGVPVVATDLGSCREIITNGQNGILVPAGNAAPLTEAAIKLLKNPALVQTLCQAAQKRVREDFSIRKSDVALYLCISNSCKLLTTSILSDTLLFATVWLIVDSCLRRF